MQYQVSSMIDGVRTNFPTTTSETTARQDAINQNGSIYADLEDDGYIFVRLQAVLTHPDGRVAVVEIEQV